jgi:hypothetical protein
VIIGIRALWRVASAQAAHRLAAALVGESLTLRRANSATYGSVTQVNFALI